MVKGVLAFCCCVGGITLCIFGDSAFKALGVIIGICALILGIYFLIGFLTNKYFPLFWGIAAIAMGALMVILCVFVDAVAYLLGGIIFCALGAVLIALSHICVRIILPLALFCVLVGVSIVFVPSLAPILTTLSGILLIFYSHVVIIFLND